MSYAPYVFPGFGTPQTGGIKPSMAGDFDNTKPTPWFGGGEDPPGPFGPGGGPGTENPNSGGGGAEPGASPTPTVSAEPCPQGAGWVRNGKGECVELWPGGSNPGGNGCGPGKKWDEATQRCVADTGSSGGTGGSGGSGGTRVTAFNPTTPKYEFTPWQRPPKTPFENDLEAQIKGFMEGWDKTVPYTPEVIRNQKTDAFRASFGRNNLNQEAVEADAIRSGRLRSTGTDRRIDSARRGAETNYAAADRAIDDTATQANDAARFRNRTAALDRAQAHLNSEREYLLSSESNDFRRQQGLAQLALAYYGLEQERWALTQQINNSNYQFNTNLNAQQDWNRLLLQWQIAQGLAK